MCQAWWLVLWIPSDEQNFVHVLCFHQKPFFFFFKSPLRCRHPQEANGMSCCFMSEARTNMGVERTGQFSSGFWGLRLIYLLVNWLYCSEVSYSLWWEELLFWKLLFAVHLRAPLRMGHTVREGGWYRYLEWGTGAREPQLSDSSQFSLWKRFTHICS